MTRQVDDEIAENRRVLRLIRENDGWALSRVLRAAELEAEVERLREALRELAGDEESYEPAVARMQERARAALAGKGRP